jgi:hypothetical protein
VVHGAEEKIRLLDFVRYYKSVGYNLQYIFLAIKWPLIFGLKDKINLIITGRLVENGLR